MIFRGKINLCEKCPLFQRDTVEYAVPAQPKLIIVGESPGKDEVLQGKPFVGKSGQYLNFVLERCGIKRADVYITNAIKCFPGSGKAKIKLDKNIQNRCFNLFLEDELKQIQVPVIALGRIAVESVSMFALGERKTLKELNNKVLQVNGRVYGFIKHPSWFMRHYGSSEGLKQFLRSFEEVITKISQFSADINLDNRALPFRVSSSADEFLEFAKSQEDGGVVVFDVETNGKPVAHPQAELTAIGVMFVATPDLVFSFPPGDTETLHKVVQELGRFKLVAHNGKFDVNFLRRFTGCKLPLYFDTLLAAYSINQNRARYSLESLVFEYCPEAALWRGDTKSKKQAKFLVGDELFTYNAIDVYATYRLYEKLAPLIEKQCPFLFWQILMPASDMYCDVEYGGAWVDKDRLAYLAKLCEKWLGYVKEKLFALPEVQEFIKKYGKYNPNSSKQNLVIARDIKQLKYYDFRNKQELLIDSTNKRILQQLEKKGDKFCRFLLQYRKLSKLHSTYAKRLLKKVICSEDGSVKGYPSIFLHRTVTGRTSSGELAIDEASPVSNREDDLSFNFQNFPRIKLFRSPIIAPPGFLIVSFDYSQIEIRVAAALAREPVWLQAFLDDLDFHSYMASLAFKVPYEEVKEKYPHYRQWAKTISFGLLYGATYFLLVEELGLEEKQAKEVFEAYFAQIGRVKEWINRVVKFIERHYYIETPFGRRRYFDADAIQQNSHRREGPNMVVQSVASDLTLLTALLIKEECQRRGWWGSDVKMFVSVHDSCSFYVREDPTLIQEVLDIITDCAMLKVREIPKVKETLWEVPLKIDFKIGRRWQ